MQRSSTTAKTNKSHWQTAIRMRWRKELQSKWRLPFEIRVLCVSITARTHRPHHSPARQDAFGITSYINKDTQSRLRLMVSILMRNASCLHSLTHFAEFRPFSRKSCVHMCVCVRASLSACITTCSCHHATALSPVV